MASETEAVRSVEGQEPDAAVGVAAAVKVSPTRVMLSNASNNGGQQVGHPAALTGYVTIRTIL